MKQTTKLTAGELSLKASSDHTSYDPLEIAEAITNDVLREVWRCIDLHYDLIGEEEFCVVMIRASDGLLKNVIRKKFYAYPFLPKPRPQQTCFHYRKKDDSIQRLWSLPNAHVMATISEMPYVSKEWQLTKFWCDAFFEGNFFESIREKFGINLESEAEFLEAHREELIQAGCNEVDSARPEPFDFSQIRTNKIVNAMKTVGE